MSTTVTSRLEGLVASSAIKTPCILKTTANHALSGLTAIDGVTPVAGYRILVGSQTSSIDNGIWVAASGAWSRAPDFNGTYDAVGGTQIFVILGSTNSNSYWKVDGSVAVVIGTDAITFSPAYIDDSASASFLQAGLGAATRTAQAKMRDAISVKDFGAVGDGATNDTAAIQAAIDTNATAIVFPPGTYKVSGLLFNNDYQHFYMAGATLAKRANGTLMTVSGRDNQFYSAFFSSSGFTGDAVVITGQETKFWGCNSMYCSGRPFKSTDVSNTMIVGGVWSTTDVTGTGYDIEIYGSGANASLYNKIIGIATNAATGGIYLNGGAGATTIMGNQFGKLTGTLLSSAFVSQNRINGATVINSSTYTFGENSFSANVTFGDGVSANIGGLMWGPTNVIQTGQTFTINSNVIESVFHLEQCYAQGVTVTNNAPNNDFYHPEVSYTPVLAAGGGSPTIGGGGTLAGKYWRSGRQWGARIRGVLGTSPSFGTGDTTISAPFKAKSQVIGTMLAVDVSASLNYIGAAQMLASGSVIYGQFHGVTVPMRAGTPFTWAVGDTFDIQIGGEYIA